MLTSHLIRIIRFNWFSYNCLAGESERMKINCNNLCRRRKKSLLFLAFFQQLWVLWTAQVDAYHSTLRSGPETFTVGCVTWKCLRTARLHCGVFCKRSLKTDLIFILHFSCTHFNPTKAASRHIASLLFMGNTHKFLQLCQGATQNWAKSFSSLERLYHSCG